MFSTEITWRDYFQLGVMVFQTFVMVLILIERLGLEDRLLNAGLALVDWLMSQISRLRAGTRKTERQTPGEKDG